MPTSRIFYVFAILGFVAATSVSAQGVSEKAINDASQMLRAAVEEGQAAGGSHLVYREGKIVHLEVAGVRDIETSEPFTADTIVRIYSMTKPITSVAAMTLYEKGKFKLDDPVSDYIPSFQNVKVFAPEGDSHKLVAPDRPLTVRDVFRHTTGYAYGGGKNREVQNAYRREGMLYRPPAAMMPPAMSIADAADALARIPTLHQPGKRFTYGFNTDLLGRLIEVWSGQPLDRYMSATVLEPLQMSDTGFSVPEDRRDRFASCHTGSDGKIGIVDKAATSPFRDGFEFLSGGGGLVSTIQDYANFCAMLVNDGEFEGNRIIRSDTLDLMFTDQLGEVDGDFQFGLGFAIQDIQLGSGDQQRQAKQYSWGGYASTDFRVVPSEKMFQIVIRQRVPSKHDLAAKLFPIIYQGVQK